MNAILSHSHPLIQAGRATLLWVQISPPNCIRHSTKMCSCTLLLAGTSVAALPIQGCLFSCIHLAVLVMSSPFQPNIHPQFCSDPFSSASEGSSWSNSCLSSVSAMTHSYGDTKLYPFPANPLAKPYFLMHMNQKTLIFIMKNHFTSSS